MERKKNDVIKVFLVESVDFIRQSSCGNKRTRICNTTQSNLIKVVEIGQVTSKKKQKTLTTLKTPNGWKILVPLCLFQLKKRRLFLIPPILSVDKNFDLKLSIGEEAKTFSRLGTLSLINYSKFIF